MLYSPFVHAWNFVILSAEKCFDRAGILTLRGDFIERGAEEICESVPLCVINEETCNKQG